ncbi:MAG: dihydrolipoamide acetyltransferase family protein [Planctomycetota bacterium]
MPKEVTLPQLGQSMETGTIVNVLVGVGDKVDVGDVLFEIETDKATLEMESPAAGFVKAVLVESGATIEVDAPMLVLGEKAEVVEGVYIEELKQKLSGSGSPAVGASVSHAEAMATAVQTVTPRAKSIAAERGIDVSDADAADALRRVEADVRSDSDSDEASPGAYKLGQTVPLNRLQKIVAEKMVYSKQNIPCFYLSVRVDVTKMVKLRTKLNKTAETKISFNDFIIRALTLSIDHYPIMTGQLAGEVIQLADTIDIGLAISAEDGLVAPIVPDCGSKTLEQVAAYCKTLAERAGENKLSLDELTGGCITVSNLGGFGVDSFIPIVVPGQTSILGVGGITDTAVPSDGNMMVKKMMNLTLSVDHKVVNGAEAAQFLDFVKKMMEHPDGLV